MDRYYRGRRWLAYALHRTFMRLRLSAPPPTSAGIRNHPQDRERLAFIPEQIVKGIKIHRILSKSKSA